jgi:hypothetical protein
VEDQDYVVEDKDRDKSDLRTTARGIAYDRACTSYEAITEFRAKLLALLPLATGTGAFLLLQKQDTTPQVRQLLGPIGLLGLAVTAGLFVYELRGMQRCARLEVQACMLEDALGLGKKGGPFKGQPKREWEILGPPLAGLIIYIATAFTWAFIAGVGFFWWSIPTSSSASTAPPPASTAPPPASTAPPPTSTAPKLPPGEALLLLLVFVGAVALAGLVVRGWLLKAAAGRQTKPCCIDSSGPHGPARRNT